MKPRISRRKFLTCSGIIGLGLADDSIAVEPFRLELGQQTFKSRNPASEKPIKLLHVSDLHASWCVSLNFIEEAVSLGLQSKPDLICLTGDFITRKYSDFDAYSRILEKLSKAAPTFASLGNHDGGVWAAERGGYDSPAHVRGLLKTSGVELLENRSTTKRILDREMHLTGIADLWSGSFNLRNAFLVPSTDPSAVRIVLSHNPDSKEYLRPYPWDLMLCGHTHGGQVVLPLIGSPWTPVHDKKLVAGMYSWGGRSIHITRGVGNVRGTRFNCPPEVSLITIV